MVGTREPWLVGLGVEVSACAWFGKNTAPRLCELATEDRGDQEAGSHSLGIQLCLAL